MATMTTCPHCRGDVPGDARKCQHCGEWLDRNDARKAKGELHPAIKVLAVAVMVALAYILVMAYFG